jgi:hypothetical protein
MAHCAGTVSRCPTMSTSPIIPNLSESTTVSLIAAGKAMGIGKTATYAMFNRGEFPLPVIKVGSKGGKARVPTAALRRLLELDVDEEHPAAETVIQRLIADPEVSVGDRHKLAAMLMEGTVK